MIPRKTLEYSVLMKKDKKMTDCGGGGTEVNEENQRTRKEQHKWNEIFKSAVWIRIHFKFSRINMGKFQE